MQVRSEFAGLIEVLRAQDCLGAKKALQLGMGECDASHHAWRKLCQRLVITLDFRAVGHNETTLPGIDIRSREALKYATDNGPYDVLFIDAGHKMEDIRRDHEIDVWRYLETLDRPANQIGSEVGIAWIVKEHGR
jgi:hypothetical protein